MRKPVDLLVLDAHGVVLNNPLRPFLRELAERTGQEPRDVLDRWDYELRDPAWTGEIDDETLWRRLAGPRPGRTSAAEWRALLESRYAPGPAAPWLERWNERVPVWVLSNHRTDWLLPRLERFGLTGLFDRVLVSDELGAAKPSALAYLPLVHSAHPPERVLFVDDKERNVRAARDLGLRALRAAADSASLQPVDDCLTGDGVLVTDPLTTPDKGRPT